MTTRATTVEDPNAVGDVGGKADAPDGRKALGRTVPYYGCKAALIPQILAFVSKRPRSIWDVFGGSAAFTLAAPRCSHQVYNDLDGDMSNLTAVLASPQWHELAERIERTVCSEAIFDQAKAFLSGIPENTPPASPFAVTGFDLDRAWATLVRDWMARNGTAGTTTTNSTFAVRFTSNGSGGASRWRAMTRSVPAWADRLADVQVMRRDAFELIDDIHDETGSVVYVDPPYKHSTRGNGGGARYRTDIPKDPAAEATWHATLAEKLRRFRRASVLVSYYDWPELRELYSGWHFQALNVSSTQANANARGQARAFNAPEVLIVNGVTSAVSPLFAQGDDHESCR